MSMETNRPEPRPSVPAALGGFLLWRGLLAAAGSFAPALRDPAPKAPAPATQASDAPKSSSAKAPSAEPQDDRLWPILKRAFTGFSDDRIMAVAAGITFYGILALFPAIAAFIALYGLFADAGTVQSHLDSLHGVMPSGALDIIGEQVKRIVSKGNSTLGLAFFSGLAISLWSANAGIKALIDGLNIAYNVKETRNFFKLNAISLGFTVGAIVFLLVAIAGVVVVPVVFADVGLGSVGAQLLTWGRWPALLLIVIGALAVMYRYGTSPRGGGWRWFTPGSVAAAVLWLAASAGFSFYASNFGSYNETYGSLGAVIGFMTWIWISMIVILAGAELNGRFEAVKADKDPAAKAAGVA